MGNSFRVCVCLGSRINICFKTFLPIYFIGFSFLCSASTMSPAQHNAQWNQTATAGIEWMDLTNRNTVWHIRLHVCGNEHFHKIGINVVPNCSLFSLLHFGALRQLWGEMKLAFRLQPAKRMLKMACTCCSILFQHLHCGHWKPIRRHRIRIFFFVGSFVSTVMHCIDFTSFSFSAFRLFGVWQFNCTVFWY